MDVEREIPGPRGKGINNDLMTSIVDRSEDDSRAVSRQR